MNLQLITLWMSKDESCYLKKLCTGQLKYQNFVDLEHFEAFISSTQDVLVVAINAEPESIRDFENGNALSILNLSITLTKRPLTHVILLAESCSPQDRLFWKTYSSATYILKPYDPLELVYSAQKLVTPNKALILSDRNFEINILTREVKFRNIKLNLGPKLFEMLKYFVENPGQTISREQFMKEVFKTPNYLDDRSIDANIKKLRKKTNYDIIETVRSKGYRYNIQQ